MIGGGGSVACKLHMSKSPAEMREAGAASGPPMRPLTRQGFLMLFGVWPPAFRKHAANGQLEWPGLLQPGTLMTHASHRSAGAAYECLAAHSASHAFAWMMVYLRVAREEGRAHRGGGARARPL